MKLIIYSIFCTLISSGYSYAKECEIHYSPIPNPATSTIVGEQRIEKLMGLSYGERQGYTNGMLSLTRNFETSVERIFPDSLKFVDQGIVVGGFMGRTYPSAVMRVAIEGHDGPKALKLLASMIGYTYLQKSVLASCMTSGKDGTPVIKVTDAGKRSILSVDNAAYLYGLLIGYFRDAENTGFTYYPESKTFTVLDFTQDSSQMKAVTAVADWIRDISRGAIILKIDVSRANVSFPWNDWVKSPDGAGYLAALRKYNDILEYDTARNTYEKRIDQFLSVLTNK